jgi:Zn-dependent peptidase ImmA (M78 family)
LCEGVSGMICRDTSTESPGGYRIYVNANDVYTRQRFTIAHEFAHYLLHRDKIGDGITDDAMYRSDKMTTQDEFAANNKAADLLMPRKLVMRSISEGTQSADALAKTFEVSVPAMEVRLRYLLYQY